MPPQRIVQSSRHFLIQLQTQSIRARHYQTRALQIAQPQKSRSFPSLWIIGTTTLAIGALIFTKASNAAISLEHEFTPTHPDHSQPPAPLIPAVPSSSPDAPKSFKSPPGTTAAVEETRRNVIGKVEDIDVKNLPVYEYGDGDEKKPKLLILGSGWAATSLIKSLTPGHYQICVLSPQNYFLFTPLLPEACTGTVEARSLLESMRKICHKREASYLEAQALDLDVDNKEVVCQGRDGRNFKIGYDICIVAVGATNQTFGVPGVNENAIFLKTIGDARRIRYAIGSNLEAAALPTVTEEEKKKLLSFVIAGGGPTGVEFSAELSDFINQDVRRLFPELMEYVRITVVQSADHILNTMAARLSAFAESRFKRQNINVLTKSRVVAVEPNCLRYRKRDADPKSEPERLPFGICVWATGIGMRDFTKRLTDKLAAQQHRKSLVVDNRLRLLGAENIYAMGDCATIENPALSKLVEEHIRQTGQDKLTYEQFGAVAAHVIREYPSVAVHLEKLGDLFTKYDYDKSGTLDIEEIQAMLTEVDNKLTSLPQTAQVASQEGVYLARKLNKMTEFGHLGVTPKDYGDWVKTENTLPAFRYSHFGTFSYVGGETAVLDLEGGWGSGGLGGASVFWVWRGAYLSRQVSFRTRILLGLDWLKTAMFGRDVSRS
ncbi:hypothetical protein SeMB42_g01832 [Synchytrium endobioticum]|uniref:Uncharacterized protein n=1 Tax=Synchytrium endobioticum TaxID=286115 RepID=A0A507DIU2_9FUNG|nr:hypothetical protein SeLEV6574_g00432 [Synchytrium endobioticum]TPX51657.1 hypothetical protein SeMB42_g01832 [Synchytrium endobioticum]